MLWPRCTLAYAPPEVVLAAFANEHISVQPSHDIWAVGVLAYEAIVKRPALTSVNQVRACASGHEPYPWELPEDQQASEWHGSRVRGAAMPCLARVASERPDAQTLLSTMWRIMMQSTTSEQ